MISSFFVSSSSFFFVYVAVSFWLFRTCVFISVYVFIRFKDDSCKENRGERATYALSSVDRCFRACADNNQLLNYINMDHFIFLWNISISPHDRLRETWVSNFPFSCNRYRFSASFKRIADPIIGIGKLIIVNVLLSILVYLFVQWLSHVWLNGKKTEKRQLKTL